MELQLKPDEAKLLIAVLKYAEDSAEDMRHEAMKLAIQDLQPVRSALLQGWLRSKLVTAGAPPDHIKGDRCPIGPLQLHNFSGGRICVHCGGVLGAPPDQER